MVINMRRKDREVTDGVKIDAIISSCYACRLGFNDNGRVYIVPLSFGFENDGGRRIFYFHSAREGRKIALIRETHYAGFEMDTGYKLNEGETACDYSARFQSVIGGGRVNFIEDAEEKRRALDMIMLKNTGRGGWEYSEKMIDAVCVFSLTVDELACKEHE